MMQRRKRRDLEAGSLEAGSEIEMSEPRIQIRSTLRLKEVVLSSRSDKSEDVLISVVSL